MSSMATRAAVPRTTSRPSLPSSDRGARARCPAASGSSAAAALVVETSTSRGDVRAAAACRALAFAQNVPSNRSAFAKRAQIAMKVDGESACLGNKLRLDGDKEPGYENVDVALVLARMPLRNGDLPLGYDLRDLDPECLSIREGFESSLVVGSLDVNVGSRLPAEELAGSSSSGKRAYLSNISVLPPARRQGIARRMIEHALQVARDDFKDVKSVYVHAELSNVAAKSLYAALGFEEESREPAAVSQTHGRPPRVLLRRDIG